MHLFKMRMKCLLRNRSFIFWTLVFPIILSTFFKLAFAKITSNESFETINIIAVDKTNFNPEFLNFIESVNYNDGRKMFNVSYQDLDTAKDQLDNNKISGFIEFKESNIFLTIRSSGINETILKTFLDDYVQTEATIISIITKSQGEVDVQTLLAQISENKEYVVENNKTNSPNLMLIYFYALLGMALIYGGTWGTNEIVNLQANLSSKGLRISISPTKRLKLLLTNISCAYIIHLLEIFLFLFYINFILGVSLGSDTLYILLLCILGSFTGITFGAFIGISLKRASEGTKIGITTLTGVVGGFLSGMMYANIKYWVNTKAPILSYINPVNVMTDGLYSLYYYPTLERYTLNMMILFIMSLVFVVGIYINFRRDDYESV